MEIQAAALLYIQNANLPSGTSAWLTSDMQTRAVNDALAAYSRLFPRQLMDSTVGTGSVFVDLEDLTGWVADFSDVLAVEYPYTEATLGDNELSPDDWRIVEHPTRGALLRFENAMPAASEAILVAFSVLHADGATTSTVRRDHVGPVATWAASYMALSLAARAASNKEITVGGTWNGQSMSGVYTSLATKLRKEAEAALGIGTDAVESEAATVIQPMERRRLTSHPWGQLTHRRRGFYS